MNTHLSFPSKSGFGWLYPEVHNLTFLSNFLTISQSIRHGCDNLVENFLVSKTVNFQALKSSLFLELFEYLMFFEYGKIKTTFWRRLSAFLELYNIATRLELLTIMIYLFSSLFLLAKYNICVFGVLALNITNKIVIVHHLKTSKTVWCVWKYFRNCVRLIHWHWKKFGNKNVDKMPQHVDCYKDCFEIKCSSRKIKNLSDF